MFTALAAALNSSEIEQKLALTAALETDWQSGKLDWQDTTPVELNCGHPSKPELVAPQLVPHRGVKTPEGRAHLLHAIVHIEFSAINLALDHAARFRGMPKQYYTDWIGVAAEEAYHFKILRQRLQTLGYDYGDFPAPRRPHDRHVFPLRHVQRQPTQRVYVGVAHAVSLRDVGQSDHGFRWSRKDAVDRT